VPSFILAFSTASRRVPDSTDPGQRWRTPTEPIPHPWANQRAPWGAMVCHVLAPSAGAGTGSEKVSYERPQAHLAGCMVALPDI